MSVPNWDVTGTIAGDGNRIDFSNSGVWERVRTGPLHGTWDFFYSNGSYAGRGDINHQIIGSTEQIFMQTGHSATLSGGTLTVPAWSLSAGVVDTGEYSDLYERLNWSNANWWVRPTSGGAVDYAPTLATGGSSTSANEGSTATMGGTFGDVNGNATVQLSASVGTVVVDALNGAWSWSLATIDGPAQSQTVTIFADDGVNNPVTKTFGLTVSNVAPVISGLPTSPVTLIAGQSLSPSGSFSDAGINDGAWTATVNYGDGSGVQSLALNPDKTFALSHAYTTPGDYTATVSVKDKDNGTGTAQVNVHVDPPPQVSIAVVDNEASEDDQDPATFQVTRTGSTSHSLTVYFTLGGTAKAGVVDSEGVPTPFDADYTGVEPDEVYSELYSVAIPAGEESSTIVLTPLNDYFYEGTETIIAQVVDDPNAVGGIAPIYAAAGGPATAEFEGLNVKC